MPTGITPSPSVAAMGSLYGANSSAGGGVATGTPINLNGTPTVTNTSDPARNGVGVTSTTPNAPTGTSGASGSGSAPTTATVVTPQAANNDLSAIATHTAQITQGLSTQAQNNSNNSAANNTPTVNGYNVGTVSSGQKGELTIQGSNGQTYYANPVAQPSTSVGDVLSGLVNGTNGTSGATTPDTETQNANDFASAAAQTESDNESAYSQMQASLSGLMSGVFPLNSAEQALVDSTNQSFQTLESSQALQNTNLQAGTSELDNVTGTARYAPEIAAGQLNQAVNSGLTKIAALETQRVQAVANLQEGFQKQDLDMIQTAYKDYTDLSTSKLGILKDINDAASTAEQNARTYALAVSSQQLTAKKDAADEAQAQADLAEKTKSDNVSESIALANEKLNQATFNATYGVFTDADGQPVNAGNVPGVTKGANGASYMDLSQFTDPKQQEAAANIARQTGMPIVSPTQKPALDQWQSVNSLLNKIQLEVTGQTGGQNATNYTTDVTNLNNALKDLATKDSNFSTISSSNIGNGGLLDITNTGTKLSNINNLRDNLNSAMSAMIPNMPTPIFGQTFTSPSDVENWALKTGNSAVLNNLKASFPNASANDLMKAINTGQEPTTENPQ